MLFVRKAYANNLDITSLVAENLALHNNKLINLDLTDIIKQNRTMLVLALYNEESIPYKVYTQDFKAKAHILKITSNDLELYNINSKNAKNLPKTGIIITTHKDKWAYCKRSLESILEITYGLNTMIHVFDNESSDCFWTPHVDKLYPGVHYHRSNNQKETGGLTGTWNKGIKNCLANDCELIVLSNNDIVVNPSFLCFLQAIETETQSFPDLITIFGPKSNNPAVSDSAGQKVKAKDWTEFQLLADTEISAEPSIIKNGYINGFFMGFHRDSLTMNMIGNNYFNPQYPFGKNESDWFKRMRTKDGVGKVINSCFVEHAKLMTWTFKTKPSNLTAIYKSLT